MVRVGIAGIGFMGMIHYLAWQRSGQGKVAAISTRDEKKLAGDWRGIQGNFGPPGEVMNLDGIAKYKELDALLADPAIDVVDLCLPPALHAEAAEAAFAAGKHVFCEKPIALTTAEADRMVAAAAQANKQLLIGHVLPFFPEFAFIRQTIDRGQHGRFLGGHFKRIISDPKWLKDFYDVTKVGGPVVDLHIHDAHFIRMLCGMPQGVFTRGRMRGDVVEFIDSQFLYGNSDSGNGGPVVSAASGVINQQGRAFTHGFEVHLEGATLIYDFSVIDSQPVLSMPLTMLTADGQTVRPELGSGDPVDAFVSEVTEVTQAITSGQPSKILGGDLARDALVLCHKQCESVISGKQVAT
jgi:predicted dehydrogenase